MKQQVDKIIANTLLNEEVVYLPQIGTLILYRNAAKLLSKKLVQAPYRELKLSNEQQGESLAHYIAQVAAVSEERASEIYTEWLEQSLQNDILTIEGVCSIKNGTITTDQTFETMANPNGRKVIPIKPRTNYFIYIIAAIGILIALGVTGYALYSNGTFDDLIEELTPAPKAKVATNTAKQSTTPAAKVETPATKAKTVAAKSEAPVAKTKAPVAKAEENKPTILPMQKGKSYAVWGVYNELKNAVDAVAWLAKRVPEVGAAHIYQYDGRYMVAVCELPSRSACGRKVSAWKAQHKSFESVWVYTR